jgi:hypothetical protein
MKGFMTAQDLQNAINTWANLGWKLDRMSSGETQGILGGKDVFLLIFRKEAAVPDDLFLMIDNQSILATEGTMTTLKANQKISAHTLACFKGMNDWRPLGLVAPELIEILMN